MKYKSFAQWPEGLSIENNTSSDTHETKEAAEAVCAMLREKGFGGDGKVFPVKTWFEPCMNGLKAIGDQLRTQDNLATSNPMFCVQIKRRDVGYDSAYATNQCWHDSANCKTIYDDDPDFKEPEGDEWEEFGYVDHWETVMVAFTENGCKDYLDLNGHNDRRRAHNGEVRIYVASFNRCPEMIAVREWLMALPKPN